MKGFINVSDHEGVSRYIAVSSINAWSPDDKYHPNQGVRMHFKDGTSMRTSWHYDVAAVAALIEAAT